jgi:hypothetical protein
VEFVDQLPESKRHKPSQFWVDVVQEVKSQPGKWANVGEFSPGVASQIRSGSYPAFIPAGVDDKRAYMERHWSVSTRSNGLPNRRCNVYVMWHGEA